MKRLLLLLPLVLAAPISAQVDPAVHKLCSDAKDYAGCVQTHLSLSKKAKSEPKTIAASEDIEAAYPQCSLKVFLNVDPDQRRFMKMKKLLFAVL